jgi:hypothetical protein
MFIRNKQEFNVPDIEEIYPLCPGIQTLAEVHIFPININPANCKGFGIFVSSNSSFMHFISYHSATKHIVCVYNSLLPLCKNEKQIDPCLKVGVGTNWNSQKFQIPYNLQD